MTTRVAAGRRQLGTVEPGRASPTSSKETAAGCCLANRATRQHAEGPPPPTPQQLASLSYPIIVLLHMPLYGPLQAALQPSLNSSCRSACMPSTSCRKCTVAVRSATCRGPCGASSPVDHALPSMLQADQSRNCPCLLPCNVRPGSSHRACASGHQPTAGACNRPAQTAPP